jgi:hypothetical protein
MHAMFVDRNYVFVGETRSGGEFGIRSVVRIEQLECNGSRRLRVIRPKDTAEGAGTDFRLDLKSADPEHIDASLSVVHCIPDAGSGQESTLSWQQIGASFIQVTRFVKFGCGEDS